MNNICCILTRDEPVMLKENIEHHLKQGICKFIVTSHVNIDENAEVLKNFDDYILKVYTEPVPSPFPQDEWRTRMFRYAYEHGAEWIIPADTDEFWYGLDSLQRVAKNIYSVTCYDIREHIPTTDLLNKVKCSRGDLPYYRMERHRYPKVIYRAFKNVTAITCCHKPTVGKPKTEVGSIIQHHYTIRDLERFKIKATTGKFVLQKSRRVRWRNKLSAGEPIENIWAKYVLTEDKVKTELANKTLFKLEEL